MSSNDHERYQLEERILELEQQNKGLIDAKSELVDFLQFTQDLTIQLSKVNRPEELQVALDTTFMDSVYDMGLLELSSDKNTLTARAFSISGYEQYKRHAQMLLGGNHSNHSFSIDYSGSLPSVLFDQRTIYQTVEELVKDNLPSYTAPLINRILPFTEKGVMITPLVRNDETVGIFLMTGVKDTPEYETSVKTLGMHISQAMENVSHITSEGDLRQNLYERNQELEAIVNKLPIMYNIVDREFRVQSASRRFLDTFAEHHSLSSIQGKQCYSVYKGHSETCPECVAKYAFQTGSVTTRDSTEFEANKAGGPFRVYAIPLEDNSGKTNRVIEAVLDISDFVSTEQRYKTLVENMEEIFWIQDDGINKDGEEIHDIIYVSPAFEPVTGYSVQSLYHDRDLFQKMIHPDDKNIPKLHSTQEYRIVRSDGNVRHIQAKTFPQHQLNGVIRTFGIAHDITELKETENSLKETSQMYQHLFDYSPVILLEEDFSKVKHKIDELHAEGISDLERYLQSHPATLDDLSSSIEIIQANRSALEFYECSSQEELREKSGVIFDPELNLTLRDRFIAISRGESSGRIENKQVFSEDKTLEVIAQWSVLSGHEEQYDRVMVSVVDQTKLYDVLHKLSESQSQYRNLIYHAPIGIVTTDYGGNILRINDALLSMTGYSDTEALTMTPIDFHPIDYRPQVADSFERMLENGYDHHTIPMQHKDGHMIHIDLSAVVSQKERWVTAYVVDRTDKVLAQEEYERAERILRHDLKNPISGIMSVSRAFIDEYEQKESTDEIMEYWLAIQQASTKAYNILQDQVISHKIVTGKNDLNIQSFNVEELVTEIYESEFKYLLSEREVSFSADYQRIDPDVPIHYSGDYHMISRLLSNLFGNAIHASKRGDTILYSALNTSSHLNMELHNEQPIPSGLRDNFFSHDKTQGSRVGEGFGKQIIKSIVELHQGSITYTSDESSGTTFYISLPL